MIGLLSSMTTSKETISLNQALNGLQSLLEKRTGGSINIRGIHYQLLYSCWLMLDSFKIEDSEASIRLEGIEDVDFIGSQLSSDKEYIQLKTSVNNMDAGAFWNMGVLQNFALVYQSDSQGRFKLVYNMKIADGNLSALVNGKLNPKQKAFWHDKIQSIGISNSEEFLSRLTFEQHTSNELLSSLQKILLKDWSINHGTELQYLRSLFFNVLEWSKERATVTRSAICKLFQDVLDSYSKAPINEAIRYEWISTVDFSSVKSNLEDYYDGQAARPSHIGMGLPVRRKSWERKLMYSLQTNDVTAIRSSSGQGKSTLAWLVTHQLKADSNIYQLHNCQEAKQANALNEFLQSRLSIGERPLVVIDGLNLMTEAWALLVEKTKDLNIKYLLTTREEDWYRYGADISKVKVELIDVFMSAQEAKEVYEQLKKKGRVHISVGDWQAVWERVHTKGLLIEYTYLLTKGQMLHDRLKAQIRALHDSRSSGAKLELLRMISLADCLDITLGTQSLITYVKKDIGFDQDRGELLNELKKEYYIDFDSDQIIGLHPVRSSHLKDLLHESIGITSSLVNLYKIINEEQKQTFFVNAQKQLKSTERKKFYHLIAGDLAEGNFSDMVFALDGIMYGEPIQYWLEHKSIYDAAYDTGGGELFNLCTIPFPSANSLDQLADIMGAKGGNLRRLAEIQRQLPRFDFKDTNMGQLALALQERLAKRNSPISSYGGLEWLVEWFRLLNVPFHCPVLKKDIDINELVGMNISEAKELLLYFQVNDPVGYEKFSLSHKATLISFLKRETNTLTIEEKGNELHMEYLLFDQEVPHANQLGVFRLQTAAALLPHYERYNIAGVMLPFPSEYLVTEAKRNAVKHLTKEALGDLFKVHINVIWTSSIEKNYQAESAYHWQKQRIEFRKIILIWAKEICRFIDALLERNESKRKAAIKAVISLEASLTKSRTALRAYPKYNLQYPEISIAEPHEKKIKDWLFPVYNFINQLNNIFQPETPHDRNLAVINLKESVEKLEDMQRGFHEVEKQTVAYFNSQEVDREETLVFRRLYITIAYYLKQLPLETKMAERVGKKAAEEWWAFYEVNKLRKLQQTLENIAAETTRQFVFPNGIEEDSKLIHISFGIRNLNFADEDALTALMMDLAPIADLDFDFCTILSVTGNTTIVGLRFKKEYFEAIKNKLAGDDDTSVQDFRPIPITIDEAYLRFYPNLAPPVRDEAMKVKEQITRALFALWKLCEFHRRLDRNSSIEKRWLEEAEDNYVAEIKAHLAGTTAIDAELRLFIEQAIKSPAGISNEVVLQQLFFLYSN